MTSSEGDGQPQPRLPYADRRQAGRELASLLGHHAGGDLLVLALPRGGVPVGAEVAQALGAELDVVAARKLAVPLEPEFGFGAIAGDVRVLDGETVATLGLTEGAICEIEGRERLEMARRERLYRGDRPPPRVKGRTVLVVDDGLATGVTARAALRSLRQQHPRRLVFAAPVGPRVAAGELAGECDEVVLAATPQPFRAVGLWYGRFDQVTDDEVVALLSPASPSDRGPGDGAIGVAARGRP